MRKETNERARREGGRDRASGIVAPSLFRLSKLATCAEHADVAVVVSFACCIVPSKHKTLATTAATATRMTAYNDNIQWPCPGEVSFRSPLAASRLFSSLSFSLSLFLLCLLGFYGQTQPLAVSVFLRFVFNTCTWRIIYYFCHTAAVTVAAAVEATTLRIRNVAHAHSHSHSALAHGSMSRTH